MTYFVLGSVIALAVVFLVSAISKIRSRTSWAAFLESTAALLPAGAAPVRPAAWTVVTLEFAAAALLPWTPAFGLGLGAALLAAFAVATAKAVRRGHRAPCRCFGASSRPLDAGHVVRNGLLATLAAAGTAGALAGPADTGGDLIATLHPAGIAVAAVAATMLATLVIFGDDITDLFAPERL